LPEDYECGNYSHYEYLTGIYYAKHKYLVTSVVQVYPIAVVGIGVIVVQQECGERNPK